MPVSCLFAITVLLILWLVTLGALVLALKRIGACPGTIQNPAGLLIDLASERFKEARYATMRLQEVADILGVGLLEIEDGSARRMNKTAGEIFSWSDEVSTRLNQFLASDTDNKIFDLGTHVIRIQRLGEIHGKKMILIQDVTEGFTLARRLKEKERLAILGQMSAQMAHQIKTPLAILSGQAQMLSRRLGHDSKLYLQAQAIYHEARELARQVSEILEFYRRKGAHLEQIPLLPVLERLRERLNHLGSSVKIQISCPKDLVVFTDGRVLGNALFLVGQNALLPGFQASRLKIWADRDGGRICVWLRDDGKGIPKKVAGSIFEPFVSTRDEGLGLGLFLARDLINDLKGEISLESAENGACFRICLPCGDIPSA